MGSMTLRRRATPADAHEPAQRSRLHHDSPSSPRTHASHSPAAHAALDAESAEVPANIQKLLP